MHGWADSKEERQVDADKMHENLMPWRFVASPNHCAQKCIYSNCKRSINKSTRNIQKSLSICDEHVESLSCN